MRIVPHYFITVAVFLGLTIFNGYANVDFISDAYVPIVRGGHFCDVGIFGSVTAGNGDAVK